MMIFIWSEKMGILKYLIRFFNKGKKEEEEKDAILRHLRIVHK